MAKNTIERQIIPELPKVVDKEQINVYVPIANAHTAGFAKFDINDFIVDHSGNVRLKYPLEQLKNADPLKYESFVKLLNTEFEYTYSNEINPYAEVKLIRSALDANIKPQLVMLDVNDFEKRNYDADQLAIDPSYSGSTGYYYYKIAKKDPYITQTIMKIDPNQFDYSVSGDAKLRIRYPYANNGMTTFDTKTPSKGFGLVRPRLDWFKFNTDATSDDYGTMYFDEHKLVKFLGDPVANKLIPEIMPIYGAVRDLQPWNNKDLYYKEDSLLRPYAVRDTNDDVTGTTPTNKIRIELTKESIGLNKLVNRYFSDWTYSDFGPTMKQYFENQFTTKLSKSAWDNKFSDYTKPLTPYEWLTHLEQEIQSIKGSSELPEGDHTHPVDLTRFSRIRANTLGIVINNEPPVDVINPTDDFLVKLTPDSEGTPINFMRLNIPYVPESQYLHNWAGQPSQDNFSKGTGPATANNYKGKFVRYWVGTKQDLADDFAGVIPDDVIVNITDDFVYIDYDNAISFTKEQTQSLVDIKIEEERFRGWSQDGQLEANVNYILRTAEDGGEASLIPLDISNQLEPYLKRVLSLPNEGALLEAEPEYYTINGKRILTISTDGAIGKSTDVGNTNDILTYKGSELLTKPVTSTSSLFLYKKDGFSQITREDIDWIYALPNNPLVLPSRSLVEPPDTSGSAGTYEKISDMILAVDVRAANKMPLTNKTLGEGTSPMFFAQRDGVWTQFTRSLNINNSITLIGTNADVAGSIGKDLYDISVKASNARLSTAAITYQTNGYGYDGYAGSDLSVAINTDWQNLLTPHTGVPVNNRRGDAVIARRFGLTSDNQTGNNRSSFNMRTVICRDAAHRDTIYNSMGVNSDRDNVLFMWPEA